MERKPSAGSTRNKERSREKFLEAVGTLLKTKGHAELKVNAIAAEAGVDKKMIYRYFGSVDGLLDEYIRSTDFWSNVKTEQAPAPITDGGKAFAEHLLHAQFDYVSQNTELQKLLLWRLSEDRKALRDWTNNQEQNGELLLAPVADIHFGKNARRFRAIMALMISGLYYLDLYPEVNGSIFCGLDLAKTEDRDEIHKALSFILEHTYANS